MYKRQLLCAYYTRALQDKEVVGKMISISPVPGLYHFISGMAKSNFRVTNAIVGRWSIIANCRVQTAKLLLDLNNIMDFDPFKQSLRLFSKKSNVKDVVWQDRIYDRVPVSYTHLDVYKRQIPTLAATWLLLFV